MNATLSLPYQTGNPKKFILFLLMVAIFIGALNMVLSHAEARHGEDAAMVRYCLNGGGEIQQWAKGNRLYRVCLLPDGRFGIQVLEKIQGEWYELTSFVKGKMKAINQVMRYLKNCGATQIR